MTSKKQYRFSVYTGDDQTGVSHWVTMSEPPTEGEIRQAIESHLGGHAMYFRIRQDGEACDMFVNGLVQIEKDAPVSAYGTQLFHAHWNENHPDEMHHNPSIHGPVVVFEENVWPSY